MARHKSSAPSDYNFGGSTGGTSGAGVGAGGATSGISAGAGVGAASCCGGVNSIGGATGIGVIFFAVTVGAFAAVLLLALAGLVNSLLEFLPAPTGGSEFNSVCLMGELIGSINAGALTAGASVGIGADAVVGMRGAGAVAAASVFAASCSEK